MYIPDVFEIPDRRDGKLSPWLSALAMTAIVLAATAALVAANYVPGEDFQITASC